jgi:hypothetical protein
MLRILTKKFAKKKKKPDINQCEGKGGGRGYYIAAGFTTISFKYLKISRIKESP